MDEFVLKMCLVLVLCLGAGCVESRECVVIEGTPGYLECPSGRVDAQVAPSARCVETETQIDCDTGETFSLPSGESEPAEGANAPAPTGPGGGGSFAPNRGSSATSHACEVNASSIRCEDGITWSHEDARRYANTECRSTQVAGLGQRIVCDGGAVLTPDSSSPDELRPDCEVTELEEGGVVRCSEGTTVGLGAEGVAQCRSGAPEVARDVDNNVTVSCAGEVVATIAYESFCEFPFGKTINSDVLAQEFMDLGCRHVYGDVFVRGMKSISFLTDVDTISGQLVIEDNPAMQTLDDLDFGLRLFSVGSLLVNNNALLRRVSGDLGELAFVEGELGISGNPRLERLSLNVRIVKTAWVVSGNESLTEFSGPRMKEEVPVFIFVDNTAFPFCRAHDVWDWSSTNVEATYIGNTAKQDGGC